jgi:hypothetical protein
VTPSSSSRTCAFGLPNKPITRDTLDRALKKAQQLHMRGAEGRAKRLLASSLALDVVFSQRLIRVNLGPNEKYKNSVLRSRWEISPVWKTAPTWGWRRSNRIVNLLSKIAPFGNDANIQHDLTRLSIHCWSMTNKDFRGLCHRIESRCDSVANLVSFFKQKTCLKQHCLPKLSAEPGLAPEKVVGTHLRGMYFPKYGVRHRPTSLGVAAMLLSVKKRLR